LNRQKSHPAMNTWGRRLRITVVSLSAVMAGGIAYVIAVASGATHTACSRTSSAGYCDTRAGGWALFALVLGAVVGGVVAALTLFRSEKSTPASSVRGLPSRTSAA
jgi:hypothetical protein